MLLLFVFLTLFNNDNRYMFRELTEDDSEKFVPVLAVDFKGDIEPTAFEPADSEEFEVETTGGKVFLKEEVDFSDDWCEYDEKNDESVSVQEIEWRWLRLV